MKLQNKKTGEIVDFGSPAFIIDNTKNSTSMQIKNLAELNEEWEDYEEPKEYWYIDIDGEINSGDMEDDTVKDMREIGNYFETEEKAEKTVEKLKAWKRLKDKGFRFNGGDDACISYLLDPVKWDNELEKDFDLLFGGEE